MSVGLMPSRVIHLTAWPPYVQRRAMDAPRMGFGEQDVPFERVASFASRPNILEFITIWIILCLSRKEAQVMLRYRDLPSHTTEVLDLTSLTVDEFAALVPPFEEAFLGYMADWTLHGRRRLARRYTTYKNCPLPSAEDRLLFILVYLKQNPTQLLHGHLFGMRQSKATQWIHVLLPVLRNTLRTLGDAPCRQVAALREQLGVAGSPVPVETSAIE